jgi:5'-3' exonuclease
MKQVVKKNRAEANGVSNEKSIYTLLVDGNNLLKISLVDKRMNDKGEEYGAVFLFLRQLGQLLQKKDFNYCIVCWDGYNSGVLRWNYYNDYKANRDKHYELAGGMSEYDKYINDYVKKVINYSKGIKKEVKRSETDDECFQRQREIIQNILENLYVRQFIYDDVEGDDLIAYYVQHKKQNEKVVIVSGDRDLTQLITDDICQYIPALKKFVTPKNSVEELGITHENTLLKKIICGDSSDNIKGIKGLGEQTLIKLFPEIKDKKTSLEAVIERSNELLEERKAAKKKPLKSLENIVNGVTDGIQGNKIYEINKKIIDLSEPLLTNDAIGGLKEEMYAPLGNEDRDIKNVYTIIKENGMNDMLDESKFGTLFGMYERIIKMEKEYFSKNATF